jgi:hypothetical protein
MRRQLPFIWGGKGSTRQIPGNFVLRQVLALPTDSSETFFKEVEENLRRDRFQDFLKSYGTWLAAAVVLFLAATGGWIYWEQQRDRQAAEQSEKLHAIFTDIAGGRQQTVPQRLAQLEQSGNDAVRASATLAGAALALEKNDRSGAIAKYRGVADDKGMPEIYRDLATIRLTALEFDTLQPQQVIARLEPLAKPGGAWFGRAGEMTAVAYLKQGKKAEAARLFASIAADKQVPDSIRSRSVQMAGTLGVDATASMPALDQQD